MCCDIENADINKRGGIKPTPRKKIDTPYSPTLSIFIDKAEKLWQCALVCCFENRFFKPCAGITSSIKLTVDIAVQSISG